MRSAAAALLLVVAVLAAWWWWPVEPSAPRAPGSGGPADARAVAASVQPSGDTAAVAHDARELVPTAGAAGSPPDAVMVDVKVVDETTSDAIPGADVWWKDATVDERVAALPAAERTRFDDDELLLRTFGWHACADERGIVRVHAHPQATRVIARAADRWGLIDVRRQDAGGVVVLRLGRDLEVTARVVDGGGRPAPGVPVSLGCATTRSTDAAGLVVFRHVQFLAEQDAGGAWVPRDEFVWLAIPGCEQEAATFALLSPPKRPLVLTLPATGELHVQVVDGNRPIGEPVEQIEADVRIPGCVDRQGHEVCWRRAADGGDVVRFDRVPIARTFDVRVRIGALELQRTVDGPTRAGQVVDATFEIPADAIALTGRIVTVDGHPVLSAEPWAYYSLSGKREALQSVQLRTDERGRFLAHVGCPPDVGFALERFDVEWQRWPHGTLHGSAAPRELQPGINDVGDITIAHLPLVVAGRLQFDAGRADDRVPLRIERWVDAVPEQGTWQAELGLDVEREDDGRFAVRGTPEPGRLRLHCGDLARPVEFERGTEGLVVHIARSHSLAFLCRLPRGLEASLIRYSLSAEATASAGPVREQGAGEWNRRAVMREEGLPAGTYTLRIYCDGVNDAIASERGIQLPGPGGECDRTIELDLSDRVPVLRLHVTGPDGEVPEQVVAFVDQDEQRGLHDGTTVWHGELTWPVPARPVDVTIVGDQWRTTVLRGVRGDVDVRLERAGTVELRAAGVLPLPDGHRIVVTVDGAQGAAASRALRVVGRGDTRLDDLTSETSVTKVANGTVWSVRAASAERSIVARLQASGRECSLHTVPDKLPAGTGSWTITFDPAEIRGALDADEKAGKAK